MRREDLMCCFEHFLVKPGVLLKVPCQVLAKFLQVLWWKYKVAILIQLCRHHINRDITITCFILSRCRDKHPVSYEHGMHFHTYRDGGYRV